MRHQRLLHSHALDVQGQSLGGCAWHRVFHCCLQHQHMNSVVMQALGAPIRSFTKLVLPGVLLAWCSGDPAAVRGEKPHFGILSQNPRQSKRLLAQLPPQKPISDSVGSHHGATLPPRLQRSGDYNRLASRLRTHLVVCTVAQGTVECRNKAKAVTRICEVGGLVFAFLYSQNQRWFFAQPKLLEQITTPTTIPFQPWNPGQDTVMTVPWTMVCASAEMPTNCMLFCCVNLGQACCGVV